MQASLQNLSLKGFLEEQLVLVEPQMKEKNIHFRLETDDSVVTIDRQLLGQAIVNLLSNAIKFTHADGEITLSAKHSDSELLIVVCDNGVGIEKEEQALLFQPFAQLKNKYQATVTGTGLGLYLTKKIVELHGGEITLESEPQRGTCFTIRI